MGENTKKMVRPPATQNVYAETSIKSVCVVYENIKIIFSLIPSVCLICKELIILLFLFDAFFGVIFLLESRLIIERKLNEH